MNLRRLETLWRYTLGLLAIVIALVSLWHIDRAGGDVRVTAVTVAGSPATVYRSAALPADAPLVVVAHGFAGSRQMMQAVSLTLAQSGNAVVAFDFVGHGRHPGLLSPDVGNIDGTTAQLVDQTVAVAQAARTLPGLPTDGPMALVGHSMATDVTIRAAQRLPDITGIVAISMYSDTVTATFPDRLLIVSGAWETRLRDVGLRFLRQVDPAAQEGDTATAGAVIRRAVAAPNVEHVGVLYSPTTLTETRDWIAAATGGPTDGKVAVIGPALLGLMVAIVIAFVPLAALGGPVQPCAEPPTRARFLAALALPVLPAAGTMLVLAGTGPVAGFAPLAGFLGIWGAAQLGVLWHGGWRPGPVRPGALGLLLGWGLVFALVLDRAGSSFVPTGPRAGLMAVLLLGTLPFALADAALAAGAPVWRRVVSRLAVLVVLAITMFAAPRTLGLVFTVLPVLVLFWLVYGSFGRWTAQRAGATTAAVGSALSLAWAIAASTPLFALP